MPGRLLRLHCLLAARSACAALRLPQWPCRLNPQAKLHPDSTYGARNGARDGARDGAAQLAHIVPAILPYRQACSTPTSPIPRPPLAAQIKLQNVSSDLERLGQRIAYPPQGNRSVWKCALGREKYPSCIRTQAGQS